MKAQILQSVVGQYRAGRRIDEQSGRRRNDEIAMGHPPLEEGVGPG